MMLVVLAVVVLAIFAPQLWAKHVLAEYSVERTDLPGTGAELARHLLAQANMSDYAVSATEANIGDHFDPKTRTVALSESHYERRSLAAAVVASHEVGHAIQHYIGYRPLVMRQRLASFAGIAEKLASVLLVAMPFVTVLTRAPSAGAGLLVAGIAILALPVVVHLVTLPVEFDASFKRAMPILETGYLGPADLKAAKKILLACALTYFAASLASMLNFWRWIQILRR